METAIEIAAKTIFETWGGSWATAPEFRREQARKEALSALETVRNDPIASEELIEFMKAKDMGDLSV